MNILVTGSRGFIGSYLCPALIADGHTVRGLDAQAERRGPVLYECMEGDIRDRDAVMKAVRSADMVVHLAARHHDFGVSETEYFEVNLGGTRNILECAGRLGVEGIVFLSSVAVYGCVSSPADENMPPRPDTPYGRSKLDAEQAITRWCGERHGRSAAIIRPAVVFGPHNYANMHRLIRQVLSGRFVFVGNGENIKSLAFVENLVHAVRFLIGRMRPGVEVYNYSDRPQMTTKEIVGTISRLADVPVRRLRIPFGLAIGLGSVFDGLGKLTGYDFPVTGKRIKKFCTATHYRAVRIAEEGFKPPFTVEEGFRKTIDWHLRGDPKTR